LDSTVSGQGPVAGCCECGDEPSGSYATELVRYHSIPILTFKTMNHSAHKNLTLYFLKMAQNG
jgi:hypothetical protein